MNDKETKFKEYEILLQVRNFHFENFHKWMIYYYIAVGSIFIAFYSGELDAEKEILILILGAIISILWHFSCKGYYFWILNWYEQIKKLENKNDIEIHSVFIKNIEYKFDNICSHIHPLRSSNQSTQKLTLLLSFIISICWLSLLIKKGFIFYCQCHLLLIWIVSLISALFFFCVICAISYPFLKSDISKHKKI